MGDAKAPTMEPAARPVSPTPSHKRPAEARGEESRVNDASKRSKPDDWMGKAGDGGKSAAGPNPAEVLKKVESKKVVSSIASKLSAPRVSKSSMEDTRKQKVGSFSAGLTKEKILESQQRHREKCEANGKPVPYYRSNH